jgi:hypothetical protein
MLKVTLPLKSVGGQQMTFKSIYELLVYMRSSKVNFVVASQYSTYDEKYHGQRYIVLTGKKAENFDVSAVSAY